VACGPCVARAVPGRERLNRGVLCGLTGAAVLRELIESGKISPASTEPTRSPRPPPSATCWNGAPRGKVVITVWAIRPVAVAPILGCRILHGGMKSGKAGVKFLRACNQALVRGRLPGRHGRAERGGRMLGVHLIHPVLPATDLGTARDFYPDRLGPGDLYRGPSSILFRCGGGTRLALTWVSLDGLDPCAAPP